MSEAGEIISRFMHVSHIGSRHEGEILRHIWGKIKSFCYSVCLILHKIPLFLIIFAAITKNLNNLLINKNFNETKITNFIYYTPNNLIGGG